MQSLKIVPAICLYKQLFRKKVGRYIFFNFFLATPQATLGYYQGDNPYQPDFDPKITGNLVARLTCFKAPGCASGQNCRKCSDYDSVSETVPLEMT